MKNGAQNSHDEEIFLTLLSKMFDDAYETAMRVEQSVPYAALFSQRDLKSIHKRDVAYVRRRVESEGLSFLTKQLPMLGKWLDRMLNSGETVSPPLGFAPYADDGLAVYPRFLQTLWRPICYLLHLALAAGHATDDFALLIKQTRTICYSFYKLEVPFTDDQLAQAAKQFEDNDALNCGIPWWNGNKMLPALVEMATRVCHEVLEGFDPLDIMPHHGPGAVATGEKYEQKWVFSHFYSELNRVYPYYEYMYGVREGLDASYLKANLSLYRRMVRDEEPTSKVVFVPKDSRGPRTICCEPLEIQYIQQGIARKLVPFLEVRSSAKGQINFKDQSVNGKLALLSSKTREYATIDLKDASDLVSHELVRLLMPDNIMRSLNATRSTYAVLPSGNKIRLEKFAPMGSALCFPVESVIFYSVCVAALRANGVRPKVASRSVFVYGDDIIIPTQYVQVVMQALSDVGLTVNADKSCYASAFLESCGVDAWLGHDITPQRFKKSPARRPSEGNALAAWLAYASQLWTSHKMRRTGEYCIEVCRKVMGFVPITDREESYLSVVIPERAMGVHEYPRTRWNAELQLFQAKVLALHTKKRDIRMDPWNRLLKDLVSPQTELNPSEVVERDSISTRQRWSNLYV